MALRHKMIEPFEERLVRKGVISFGLSSYGYDMRLADEFLIFTNVWGAIVDPKAFDERAFVRHKGDFCIIPPNSFVLGRSVEYFRIPREVLHRRRQVVVCPLFSGRHAGGVGKRGGADAGGNGTAMGKGRALFWL